MTKELNQKLINTWDWLNSYCLSKRGDADLACGKHAVCIVQIDDFANKRVAWGTEKTKELLKEVTTCILLFITYMITLLLILNLQLQQR